MPVNFALGSLVSLVSAIIAGWLCGRWLEQLPFRAIGAGFSNGWFKHLVIGLALGAGSLTLAVALAMALGDFRFALNPDFSAQHIAASAAVSFLVLALAAAFEEAFFRGYMFQTLTRSGLAWLAMVLTAGFFGAVHLGNPGAGNISTVDTMIAGILFGSAYLKTRDLWFPFGIHLMWNWMQGSVFGIEVSGLTELSSGSILKEIDRGPEWLTGGLYGIEGGIASTAALIVTLLIIYFIPIVRADNEMLALTGGESTTSGS
jgi:membrane protease YdiL (CAAX protease family)